MVEIIPAILTSDPKELEEKIRLVEEIMAEGPELCRRVQIDIVDGVFAPNRTVLPDVTVQIETSLLVDFQLMTKEPTEWVEHCIRGMADRIFGHIEMMTNQAEFLGKVQEVGAKVGLALDLGTPINRIDPTIFSDLDGVLIMSVKAGFGGQKFDESVLPKIKALDEIRVRDDTPFRICLDGGITEDNIAKVARAGADEVAVGRRLFTGDIAENIRKLQEAAYKENE